MKNFTLKGQFLLTVLMLTFTCSLYAQEIGVLGNGTYIADNDVTPTTADWTNFGTVNSRNFTIDNIQNSGNTTLNVTGITLSNTTDFSVSTNPSPVGVPKNGPDPTFTITFIGSGTGTYTSTVTITSSNASNDGADNAWVFTISADRLPEINIQGNGQNIAHNDATPTTTDGTDFGSIDVALSIPHTFTIQNTGIASLSIGAITFGGANPGDFSITSAPASTVAIGASTTFQVTFTPSAVGVRTGRINIVNNDSDENPYAFTIRGTGLTPQPEINITGLSNTIVDGDTTPSVVDNTDFGSTGTGSPINHTFNIQNTGSVALSIGAITFSGANPGDFSVTTPPAASVAASGNTNFIVAFNPTGNGTRTATISIVNNDNNENPYDFTIQGTGVVPLTEGPGGVTSDLALWLKGTDGLGYTNGQAVSLWADQGRGANATAPTGLEPTYRDAPTYNVNFNPVIDFDNDYNTAGQDYGYTDTNRTTLVGTSGFYTQDMFVVVIPDVNVTSALASMDVFCGDADPGTNNRDGSGIGYGRYSVRFTDEVISYCVNTTSSDENIAENLRGYGIAHTSTTANYNNVGIINSKNNNAGSPTNNILLYNANSIGNKEVGIPQFANVNNSRYFLGRSEAFKGSYEGRIAEVITYTSKKTDTDLTVERNRIQSYLAIKYGITLGVNGTSQDYVDSSGSLIWDANTGVPANDAFNYDIAGIGRDDDSDLLQKQSRSVNNAFDGGFRAQGVLTIGMGSISNTNKLNTNTELEDKEYLVWGNNGIDLDIALPDITVNMSSDIAPSLTTDVSFEAISRTWKVVENVGPGGDIPLVEVAILKSAVRTATPPDGRYLMFISDTPNFDPTADYRVMTEGTNELGEAILKTNYDFDDTKYITFGWAPERTFERSVYFNGSTNYIDMEDALDLNPTAFTISAWVKRESGSLNKSILSKRDAAYTEGYDFKINASGNLEVSWYSSGTKRSITSNTIIPENTWHHLAIIYQSPTAKLYIDGVLDKQAGKTDPDNNTNQSFYIGAASKLAPEAFFKGNIDEVRVWNTAITEDQLRYIMNQEIENNSGFVGATYFAGTSISPTKNEIATIPWTALAGYYPMSTYTYTNTKDESGNGHQGALRTLRTVDRQTAPLPYKSNGNGDWDTNTTWLNGDVQTIPGGNSIVDANKTIDWNIVETDHNILMDNSSLATSANGNRNLLALNNKSNTITVDGVNNSDDADNSTEDGTGFGLTITHFLNISGKIDLEGESQLIQTLNSDLVVGASGILEKDQQGTKDLFTYNYWSSPVGFTEVGTNNYSYKLNDNIFKDGTTSATPANITFVSGYDGATTPSLRVAHYWLWKYANNPSDDYSQWQHIRNTGTILAGEGFTMKGVANTSGDVEQEQNYVFQGKPNNGDILTLTLNAGNDYLVGNPYASAIDADQFIMDNGNTLSYSDPGGMPETDPLISGTLYFWEHWGGGSHVTAEYQGGYGTYNFSGGVPGAGFIGTSDPDVDQTGTGTKTPGRYIPVGQGFFVTGQNTGLINFNNGQRVFKKEGSTSVFVKQAGKNLRTENDFADSRMRIRIGFNSINTIHRQLLVTEDPRATLGVDWGFDGLLYQNQMDDMYWSLNNDKYTIQGIDYITESTVLPLGVHTSDPGLNNIIIDLLENVPDNLDIYVHDKELDIYHDLRVSKYQIYLEAGEYLDRFEITFTNQFLSVEENELANSLQVSYVNANESIMVHNPESVTIKSIEMYNVLGQSIFKIDDVKTEIKTEIETNKLSAGNYIIKLKTEFGVVNKKVLVN